FLRCAQARSPGDQAWGPSVSHSTESVAPLDGEALPECAVLPRRPGGVDCSDSSRWAPGIVQADAGRSGWAWRPGAACARSGQPQRSGKRTVVGKFTLTGVRARLK